MKVTNIIPRLFVTVLVVQTAALDMLSGGEGAKYSRKPEIMADAAYAILSQDPTKCTGNFYIDEDVLKESGVTDFDQYCIDPNYRDQLMPDLYIGDPSEQTLNKSTPTPSAEPEGPVAQLFKKIEASMSPSIVQSTEAVFQFVVTGKEAGKWYVDLKTTQNGACGKGDAPVQADATLQMDSEHFFSMFSGKLKPATAYMTGKLKIKGNLQKALKLEKLMKSLKSKL